MNRLIGGLDLESGPSLARYQSSLSGLYHCPQPFYRHRAGNSRLYQEARQNEQRLARRGWDTRG